jgi:hypothetical protein
MTLEQYWLDFTRTQDFPREVCAKDACTELASRKNAINSHQFIDFMKCHNGKQHCFMGLFSKMQRMCKIYDTVFFDVDALSLDTASEKAHTIIDAMKSAFRDASPRIYFSGKKGYHLYYDIEPTYLQSYSSSVYCVAKRLKIHSLVDSQVLSDSILCRMPYSVHMSTKLMCIPILARQIGKLDALRDMALHPVLQDFKMNMSVKLAQVLRSYTKDVETHTHFDTEVDVSEDPVPLCVSSSYDRLVKGTAEHSDRVFLAMYLLNVGAGVECALSAFKAAPDYVPKRTRYQVNYTERKKLKIYGCRTLIRNGVCPLDADTRCLCSWYPNIYRKLKIVDTDSVQMVQER